ncbi:TetR family transcriptional regulator [Streptomyces sp. NPDC001568]|uniref:TetR family transcriptional regulator n=1 Tax=Streptomyces sp. NPDC001568 TaxID=3364588 RepID=UPI003688CC68
MSPGPTPKGQQRRAALLDAAERVLTSAGGSELTLRAVAEEAGVRLGHLQYYFPARADLLAALLDRVLTTSLERVTDLTDTARTANAEPDEESGLEPGPDPGPDTGLDTGLDAALDALLDGVLSDHDDPRLVRLFTEVWALAAHDEEAASAVRAFYDRYASHVASYVRDHAPGVSAADARHRAEVFVMLMEGSALFRSGITGRRSTDADARLRAVARALLGGEARP